MSTQKGLFHVQDLLLCLEDIKTIELPAFLNLRKKIRKQCLQTDLTPRTKAYDEFLELCVLRLQVL